jgi:hypothetical protein
MVIDFIPGDDHPRIPQNRHPVELQPECLKVPDSTDFKIEEVNRVMDYPLPIDFIVSDFDPGPMPEL